MSAATAARGARVLDCGHVPTPDAGAGTGYAYVPGGRKVCYGCADSLAAQEVAAAKPGDRLTFYVSTDGRTITTWSGGVLMTDVRYGRPHPFSRGPFADRRHYLRAVDVDGRVWSGVGAAGMWATLRLTRQTARPRGTGRRIPHTPMDIVHPDHQCS